MHSPFRQSIIDHDLRASVWPSPAVSTGDAHASQPTSEGKGGSEAEPKEEEAAKQKMLEPDNAELDAAAGAWGLERQRRISTASCFGQTH
eukprot:2776458-Pleurochrysis_carterae.AAC.1